MTSDMTHPVLSRRGFVAGSACLVLAGSTRRARALATFNVLDFGAVRGADARGPDAETTGRRNNEAFRKALEAARAADGGTVLFPRGDYVVAALDGGSRNRTPAGRAPRQALVMDGCRNVRLVGEGGARLIRPESDIIDKDGSYDATLCIRRSANIVVEGLTFEGQQAFKVKQATTGDNILLELGSQDIVIRNVTCDKGTNAVAVGVNRTFDGDRVRYNLKLPVKNVEIRNVHAYNGEHGILVNIAESVTIDGFFHDQRSYGYGGIEQDAYIQRGIYLLGCRDITVRNVALRNIHKVSLFMSLYPPHRSLGNLSNISISNLRIDAAKRQNNDFHVAIQLADANYETGPATIVKDVAFDTVNIQGSKVGISLGRSREREDGPASDAIPRDRPSQDLSTISFTRVTARTTKFGVKAVFTKPFGRISIAGSRFDVAEEPAYAPPGNVGEGMQVEGQGRSDELFLKDLDVLSTDKGASFSNISGSFTNCRFGYTSEAPSGNRFDLRMHDCDVKMADVTLRHADRKAP